MVIIQKKNFKIQDEISAIKKNNNKIGSVVTFVGYVRDFDYECINSSKTLKIFHYDGMTEKVISEIIGITKKKWDIDQVNVIHRVGNLKINDPIVLVIVSSSHRQDAFSACNYVIDHLKTKAPFWKKEVSNINSKWVEQKESDLVKVK